MLLVVICVVDLATLIIKNAEKKIELKKKKKTMFKLFHLANE